MKASYIRVSTSKQNIDSQLIDTEYSLAYMDVCSGSIPFMARPEALKLSRNNKITSIRVREVSRLGRNLSDILKTIEFFTGRGVNIFIENQGLHTLIDGKVNPSAQLIISMFGAVAQMERDLLLERTQIGVNIAKANGKYKGRKRGATTDLKSKNHTLLTALQYEMDCGHSISVIARKHNITRQRIYSYIAKGLLIRLSYKD